MKEPFVVSLSNHAPAVLRHAQDERAKMFRYPSELEEPPVTEAEEALALAREVYDAVLGRLPGEVRP